LQQGPGALTCLGRERGHQPHSVPRPVTSKTRNTFHARGKCAGLQCSCVPSSTAGWAPRGFSEPLAQPLQLPDEVFFLENCLSVISQLPAGRGRATERAFSSQLGKEIRDLSFSSRGNQHKPHQGLPTSLPGHNLVLRGWGGAAGSAEHTSLGASTPGTPATGVTSTLQTPQGHSWEETCQWAR